jgi:hypothetical protein
MLVAEQRRGKARSLRNLLAALLAFPHSFHRLRRGRVWATCAS